MLQKYEYTCGDVFYVYGGMKEADSVRADLNGPAGLAIDGVENIYVAEARGHRIRKINVKSGLVTTIAGCGECGFDGDGGPAANAHLHGPEGVFVDSVGNVLIADTYNQRIRKVDGNTGIITTIAGNGKAGYQGDGIDAREAMLNEPAGVVADKFGNVYFNDYRNERVRKINTEGIITTYAGTGTKGYWGDGGPAYEAQINEVYGLAIDKQNNLYLMDSMNFAVRKIDAVTQIISTLFQGDMNHPHAVEITDNDIIFVADTGNERIQMFDNKQNLRSVIAADSPLFRAHGLRMDSQGNLYFIDFIDNTVKGIKIK